MTHGELGRLKLEKTIKERMLNFWTRLVTGKMNKISYSLYVHLKDKHESGEIHSKWFSQISSTLDELELSHLIDSPQPISASTLKTLFRLKLNEKYTHLWLNETQTSGSCSTYRKFKKKLKLQPYLSLLKPQLYHMFIYH